MLDCIVDIFNVLLWPSVPVKILGSVLVGWFSKQAISPVSFRVHVLTCPPWFQCQSIFQGRCSSIRPAHEGSSQEPVLTARSFSTLSPGCFGFVSRVHTSERVPLELPPCGWASLSLALSPLCFPPTLSSSQQPAFWPCGWKPLGFGLSVLFMRLMTGSPSRATWRERKGEG